jgi:cobalt-zinc-cadmium efflux system outer membrane protein
MVMRTLAVCAAVCLHATAAAAQVRIASLADVLARAREQSPEVVSARLALEEARGRLAGASVRFQSNPDLGASIGPRHTTDTRYTDFELGVAQMFEPGARRSARIDGANAAFAQSTANIEEVTRSVLRQAASGYYRAVHANERIRLLTSAYDVASSVYTTADRRFRSGEIAVLDVNIARASRARVAADREAAEADRSLATGELRRLLRIDGELIVEGSLPQLDQADLTAALQSAGQRPEIRMLEAGIREAEAELRIGSSFSKPEYGVGITYAREEGDHIVLGSMKVTLPMFSKGQEQRITGAARAARLRADLDATRSRVQLEIRARFDAYTRRLAALRLLETEALPGLDENEQLTTRSFEVGQIGLPDLLLIRREILDTRAQYLDALLEAALARVDLDASAALLR